MNRVREALGDSSDNPRFVETLPRRGYRFIAPVEQTASVVTTSTSQNGQYLRERSQQPQVHEPVPGCWPAPTNRMMKSALFVLAALFADSPRLTLPDAPQTAKPDRNRKINQDVRVSPLTALPGYVGWPALSPDGKQVVFAWDGGRNAAKSMFDLYIKVIGAERIEQLHASAG